MKKDTVNYILDSLAFLAMSIVLSTGLMLKYLFPHGRGPGFGGGFGQGRLSHTLLGLNRHDWGEVHFYVSLFLVATVAAHLALHWRWIVAVAWGKMAQNRSPLRRAALLSTVLIFTLIIVLPFAIGPTQGITGKPGNSPESDPPQASSRY